MVKVFNNKAHDSVKAKMSTGKEVQMMKNRTVLCKTFAKLRFLGRRVAVRGKTEADLKLSLSADFDDFCFFSLKIQQKATVSDNFMIFR